MVEAEDDLIARIYLYKDGGVTLIETDFECEILVVPPYDEDSHVDRRSKRVVTGCNSDRSIGYYSSRIQTKEREQPHDYEHQK
tara:strand:- start:74 stop:322 length:249 start_codon:yes stop_codon:yes gene_type:complete